MVTYMQKGIIIIIIMHANSSFLMKNIEYSEEYFALWIYDESFGDCTKSTIYTWYHRHFHVP